MSNRNQVPLSQALWGRIHAKAWSDETFRDLLEREPGTAVRNFCSEANLPVPEKVMYVSARPESWGDAELAAVIAGEAEYDHAVPACC